MFYECDELWNLQVSRVILEGEFDPEMDPNFYKACKGSFQRHCGKDIISTDGSFGNVMECMKVGFLHLSGCQQNNILFWSFNCENFVPKLLFISQKLLWKSLFSSDNSVSQVLSSQNVRGG
jgi:hypothetical protein